VTARPLRLGVIGLGKMAQTVHLPHVEETPGIELAAVCDLHRDVLDAVGERWRVAVRHRHLRHEELLADAVDAVLVCNHHHAPCVLAAIDAGRHVLVEKPLCWSLAEADAIVERARRARVAVMVGYMRRYDPGFATAAEAVRRLDAPALARFHDFAGGRHRAERLYRVVKPAAPSEEEREQERLRRAAMADAVGGDDPGPLDVYRELTELCVHDLNMQRALFGPPEAIEHARSYDVGGRRYHHVAMRCAGGLRSAWEVAAAFTGVRDWDHHLAVYGTGGSVTARFASPFVRNAPTMVEERCVDGLRDVRREVLSSYESPFALELRHFADCVREGRPPLTGPEEARADLATMIEIAMRSVPSLAWGEG
jgi:predicted dehydrogenase